MVNSARWAVHFGDARGRQDLDAAVASVVQLSDQVVRHVLGAGEKITCRKRTTRERQIWRGDGIGEPVAVTQCQAVLLRFSTRGVAVAHVQRPEDVVLDIGRVAFAADGLDD